MSSFIAMDFWSGSKLVTEYRPYYLELQLGHIDQVVPILDLHQLAII